MVAKRKTVDEALKNIMYEARRNGSTNYRPLVRVFARKVSPAQEVKVQKALATLDALYLARSRRPTVLSRSWAIGSKAR